MERCLNKFIYLHDQLDWKISKINSKTMRRASAFIGLFNCKLFCFYRLLCMLVLPWEYLVFEENKSSTKASFCIICHKLASTATVAKSIEDPFASWLADVYIQPWNCTQIWYPVNKICCKNKSHCESLSKWKQLARILVMKESLKV